MSTSLSSRRPAPDSMKQRPRDRASRSRPLVWGLGLSVLIHLLIAIVASRTWIPVRAYYGGQPISEPGVTLPEMRAHRLDILEDDGLLSPDEPPPAVDADLVPPRRTPSPVPPVEGRGEEVVDRPESAITSPVDRLRPDLVDPRLWERAEAPPPVERTDFERARDRVYARLQMLNDSAAAESEAERRATDWTFTDKDGKRWGVSPGSLHLGGVTVPLPFGFSPSPDQAREGRERASRAGEIRDHADRARVRGTFEEAVKSTRAERDRARSARRDSTSTD